MRGEPRLASTVSAHGHVVRRMTCVHAAVTPFAAAERPLAWHVLRSDDNGPGAGAVGQVGRREWRGARRLPGRGERAVVAGARRSGIRERVRATRRGRRRRASAVAALGRVSAANARGRREPPSSPRPRTDLKLCPARPLPTAPNDSSVAMGGRCGHRSGGGSSGWFGLPRSGDRDGTTTPAGAPGDARLPRRRGARPGLDRLCGVVHLQCLSRRRVGEDVVGVLGTGRTSPSRRPPSPIRVVP